MTGTLLALAMVEGSAADITLRAELRCLARRRIFFAHRSVGAGLLGELQKLAAKEAVRLQITGMLAADNGDPLAKLRGFEQAMDGPGRGADISIFKFCYADVCADTDAAALFAAYQATMGRLRGKHPSTVFVHVTLPLTHVQGGLKALAKRALGRYPYGTLENLRREEYNSLLRRTYRGRDPVFDLARVESTAPDGAALRVACNEKLAPVLAREYTDDGGHLNALGRVRAARELVSVLASIPLEPAGSIAPRRHSPAGAATSPA